MQEHVRTRTIRFGLDVALALIVVAGGLLPATAIGQAPSPQQKIAAIKEALAKNQAALRQYSWIETTQVSLKGEVKKTEQKQCYYGAEGKVTKTPMPGAAPPKQEQPASGGRGRGRLKQKIVENKVEETKEYMEQVAALVHAYVPPDPQKIQAAQAGGNVSVEPTAATTTMTVKNYLKQGDVLAIGLDSSAKTMRSLQVGSYVEKPKDDDVTLNVTFANLVDGTSYPQKSVLNVAAKKIQVTVTNSGYKKTGS
jgi:23S rRNA pseudoU1915 N3-methylase RlmH